MVLDDELLDSALTDARRILSAVIGHRLNCKPAHKRNPIVLWASSRSENLAWIAAHTAALASEFTIRIGIPHPLLAPNSGALSRISGQANWRRATAFVNLAHATELDHVNSSIYGTDFRKVRNTFLAYRAHLAHRWHRASPRWRTLPWWPLIGDKFTFVPHDETFEVHRYTSTGELIVRRGRGYVIAPAAPNWRSDRLSSW